MTRPFRLLPALALAAALCGCQVQGAASLGELGAGFVLPPLMEADRVELLPAGQAPRPPAGSGSSAPRPSASAAPPSSGSGGSSGGGAPAAGALTGQVIGVAGLEERPLAGAIVRASDGREATTDASGRFTLEGGLPADGGLTASLPGYTASAVVGLDGGAPVRLHLKAQSVVQAQPSAPVAALRAVGRVVGPDGAPRPNLTVVLEDARGASSAPATTDSDGAFELKVFAPGAQVVDGTLIALGGAGDAWMGMATHLSLSAASPDLDLDAAAPGNSPLVVRAATHPLKLAIDTAPGGGGLTTTRSLTLVGPGASLSVPVDGQTQTALVADVPGARFDVRADVLDPVLGTASTVRLEAVAIDFAAPVTTVTATMLAPPQLLNDANLEPGGQVAWLPVTGAQGYSLALAGLADQGFVWEAFGAGTSAPLSYRDALPPGDYGLTVTAWDDAALSPRSVAAIGPARLRVLPIGHTYRRSSRQVRRSLS